MSHYGRYDMERELSELVGVVLSEVEVNEERDKITFTASDGRSWEMYHSRNCCESVGIEEIHGDS